MSNITHAKPPLSAIYRETRTQATHVHGKRHSATSTGGLRSRNSDMERKFKYIKQSAVDSDIGAVLQLGGFTRNQQTLTIKT